MSLAVISNGKLSLETSLLPLHVQMKIYRLILLSILVLLLYPAFAYKGDSIISIGSDGKYAITGVKEITYKSQTEILEKVESFLKNTIGSSGNLDIEPEKLELTGRGQFEVPKYGTLTKQPDGIVSYNLTMLIEGSRMEYEFTNFIFQPYKRNRYGKFEPVPGKYFPLEFLVSRYNQKTWEQYRRVTVDKVNQMISELNTAISNKN